MAETARDADWLRGKQVAFTGRFASMTRKEAAELVRTYGGRFVPTVTRRTAYLIVGQEGWPLRKNGRLTIKLLKAQALERRGYKVSVLSEEELLARLGLDSRSDEARRLHTTAELTQLLNVPRDRLRAWMDAGLVRPVESSHGIAYFDFRQVAGAKTLCDLIEAGVTAERLRRSLEQLRIWARDVEQPLTQLAMLERDGHLLVRIGDALAEPTGQLLLEFADGAEASAVAFSPNRLSADDWYDLACRHEDAGRLAEAEAAYRQALTLAGPDAACLFNLANVLCALGRKPEAAECLHQAVTLNDRDPGAWNNLGAVLADLKRFPEAKAAYQKAISLGYADAHYNLADLLRDLGDHEAARRHWRAYLRQDPNSRWARYARACMGKRM